MPGLISSELDELAPAIVRAFEPGRAFDFQVWGRESIGMIEPIWLLKYLPNMLACHISILIDCQGPSNTITEAEASANLAIAEAARIIARGRADVMITGGADSKIHPLSLVRMGLLDKMSELERRAVPGVPAVRPPARRLGARRGGGHPDPGGARARPAARGAGSTARSSAAARAATRRPAAAWTPTGIGTEVAIAAALEDAGLDAVRYRPRQRPRLGHPGLRPGRGTRLATDLRPEGRARDRPQGLHGQPGLRLRRRRADRQPDRASIAGSIPPILNCDEPDPEMRGSTWSSERPGPTATRSS